MFWKKIKWKNGVHLLVTHANNRSIRKNLIARWPKDNRNQIKKIEPKAYFSSKEERLFWILVCRKKTRTYKCILCRYLYLDWRNNRILEPTYKIFFKEKRLFWLILVCDKNQTKFVHYHKCILCGYLRLDLDWKDNRILEPKTYFSNEEKKFILLILVCEKKPKLSVPHVYFVSVSILFKIFGCFLQRIST